MKNPTSGLVAFLIAAIGVILFSAKAIMVKMAYEYNIDAVSLLLIRMVFALPIYALFAFKQSKKHKNNPIEKRHFIQLIGLGVLGYYFASYLDFMGLNYVTASIERLVLFIYPTLVVIISGLFLRNPVSKKQKSAVVITYLGVALAFFKYSAVTGTNSNIPLGVILIFGAALTYAIYLVGCGNLIPKIGSVRFTSYAMIIACLAVIIHYSIIGDFTILDYQLEVYFLGSAMAIFSTIIPSFLLAEAIKRIGPSNVAIVGSIGPISTIILAIIFLGERITVFQFFGTIIVILGVLLIALDRKL